MQWPQHSPPCEWLPQTNASKDVEVELLELECWDVSGVESAIQNGPVVRGRSSRASMDGGQGWC